MCNPDRNEEFDQLIDEVFPPYVMGEVTFYASDILADCDPIAYRISLSEWESEQADQPWPSECDCGCGCEVPLDGGQCVDCGDGTHQNNNDLDEYRGE